MITSKNIDRIVVVIIVISILLSLGGPLYIFGNKSDDTSGSDQTLMKYETEIFDTSKAMEINIVIEKDKWKNILENAAEKKWQSCDVVVNGTKFSNVAIRTKGDNSLEGITEKQNSNRYSFKLEFDKYNKGQTCFGLDKLCLNNNYGDATSMKEALIYDMFKYMGAEAPLYNYAKIMVNGEYWGVYLALEAVEDSFLTRNYGSAKGALYKPGSDNGAEETDFDMEGLEEEENNDSTEAAVTGGADLNYVDDKLSSYSSIFECEVNKTDKSDHKRVIKALKNISRKKNLDFYMDIDNILKYMAVHNFSVNYDSLLGDGDHNYYLYESEGKLSLIPWDYNLCLGAYECEMGEESNTADSDKSSNNSSDGNKAASDVINKSIDDSWQLTSFFDGILQNDKYLKQYHKYYQKLIDEYVLGPGFKNFYTHTRKVIDGLVKTDPTALYTYQEYNTAAKTLQQVVYLRGQSVNGQLQGKIPSTSDEQEKQKEKLVDCTGIDLNLMGSDSDTEETKAVAEDTEWSEEEWKKYMTEAAEQQKSQKKMVIRNNVNQMTVSLAGICTVITGICFIRKRR